MTCQHKDMRIQHHYLTSAVMAKNIPPHNTNDRIRTTYEQVEITNIAICSINL